MDKYHQVHEEKQLDVVWNKFDKLCFIYYLLNFTAAILLIVHLITLNSQFLSVFSFSNSVSQPSIKMLPSPTLLDLPYQQQTMGAVSLVDQDT